MSWISHQGEEGMVVLWQLGEETAKQQTPVCGNKKGIFKETLGYFSAMFVVKERVV